MRGIKLLSRRLRTLTFAHARREALRLVRLATRAEMRMMDGRALPPYSVSFWLTDRCNLSCPMCWVRYSKDTDELSTGEICRVLEEIAPHNPRIGLTGGEPLLRGDVVEIVAFAGSRGLRVGLNTNGLLLAEAGDELVEAGLDTVSISLDGVEGLHDRLRGKEGSFRRAVQGIIALEEAKRKRGRLRPLVRVLATVTPQTFKGIPGLLGELGKLPLDSATVQHLWFTDQPAISAHQALSRRLLGEESPTLGDFLQEEMLSGAPVAEMIAEVKGKDWGLPVHLYPDLSAEEISTYYRDARGKVRGRCLSRWLRVDIAADGTVTPCLGYNAGNIRQAGFGDIWNGERMRRFRRVIGRRGTLPGCSRCCGLFSD